MSLTIQYKEYTTMYDRHNEKWVCTELGLEAPQLNALIKKIDGTDASTRKLTKELKAWAFADYSGTRVKEVTVTSIVPPNRYEGEVPRKVWVKRTDGSSEQLHISELMPIGDETTAAIEEIKLVDEQIKLYNKKRTELIDARPRYTLEDIKKYI